MKNWKYADFNRLVCHCRKVNKKTIVEAIEKGNNSLEKIKGATKACTGGDCKNMNPTGKCCSSDIIELIRIYSPDSDNGNSGSNCGCC